MKKRRKRRRMKNKGQEEGREENKSIPADQGQNQRCDVQK